MQNQRGFIGIGVLIAIILGIVVLGGGTYFVTHKDSFSQTDSQVAPLTDNDGRQLSASDTKKEQNGNNINTSTSQKVVPSAQKGNVEFSKVVEISKAEGALNGGYIAGSTEGKTFWVANNKLAYVLDYFGNSEHALICDGKEIYRAPTFAEVMSHKPETAKSCSVSYSDTGSQKVLYYDGKEVYRLFGSDFITGAQKITDVLAYYTFGGDFFFGGQKYSYKGTLYDATSIGGKLALRTTEGSFYDGKAIDPKAMEALNTPAYGIVPTKIPTREDPSSKMVVMHNGTAASEPYDYIRDLQIVGGKIAFRATKSSDKKPTYILVYDGKEYGKEYGSVIGYIDSNGSPAYIAEGYKNDVYSMYLVKNGDVLYSTTGEERIWPTTTVDINGALATIIRTPMTDSLYVWYGGKKFFEGYSIFNILNVNGKLAVLAEKDKVQTIFLEK